MSHVNTATIENSERPKFLTLAKRLSKKSKLADFVNFVYSKIK
jgi:hypothetical protein